ncbi:MAG: beta-galactosidase [Planctomycetes bacterium]|nr:beta-galactosidase [Planctomycetota bacterium]
MTKTKKKIIIFSILIISVTIWLLKTSHPYPRVKDIKSDPSFWGVTFSTKFSEELGLNWQEAYLAILDDLKVKDIRIPVYWDEIETQQNKFDFSDYDFILNEGAKRQAKFTIAIGRRLPRWPECHSPEWLKEIKQDEVQKATLKMLETVVERYKSRPEIIYWQVENEPLLDLFGECPDSDPAWLREEVSLVRKLDDREIIISGSGELSSWQEEGRIGDIFGTTMYRVVYNSAFGYIRYPWPATFYSLKAKMAHIEPQNRIVAELQAEPWVPNGKMSEMSNKEADRSMSLEQFKSNLQFAQNVGFSRVSLWGVEWWYFKLKQGDSSFWYEAKKLFTN